MYSKLIKVCFCAVKQLTMLWCDKCLKKNQNIRLGLFIHKHAKNAYIIKVNEKNIAKKNYKYN